MPVGEHWRNDGVIASIKDTSLQSRAISFIDGPNITINYTFYRYFYSVPL